MTAAQQLAQWLESTHSGLFNAIHQRALKARQGAYLRNARLRGFGDDSDGTFDLGMPDLSSDVSDTVVPAGSYDSVITDSYSASAPIDITTVSPSDLVSPSVSSAISASTDIAPSTDTSGGFLQSIGSGIATAATNVGSFLTSQQGLNDLTKLGTAYFQLQNTAANAQLQTAVLNAQVARASQGQSPLPITYARSPTGQMVPVYATSPLSSAGIFPSNMPSALQASITAGQSQLVTLPDGTTAYTVPPNIVGSLSTNLSSSQILPWILLIGAGLILLKGAR